MANSVLQEMVKAMIEVDSGPVGSALFDIHYNEFHDGYEKTLRAALHRLSAMSGNVNLIVAAQDSFENDGLGVNPYIIEHALEAIIAEILKG